jgi:hypothetical protein
MNYLRTNTATRITVGPFLDKTDGITPEVALTATNEHLTLIIDDGGVPTLVLDANATASGGNNDMVHVANDDAGYYDLELTAAQTNYLGRGKLSINYVTDHCPVFHELVILPAQVYDSLILGSDLLDVNGSQLGGTNQTGRDVGASVLLSSGTGTGQLDFTSGVVKANLVQILATALTETTGQIAAAFKQFFNVASPTGTMKAITAVDTVTNLTNAPTAGDLTATMKTSVTTAASAATPALSAGGVTAVQSGLATSAELAKVPKSDSTVSWNATALAAIQSECNDALIATVADSVPSDGTRPSVAQGILMLTRLLMEKSVSGTTVTIKKEDGSTTSMTFTLNDGTSPTSITRAS